MTHPNILLIMADQLAPHWTGTYGHAQVQTPNLDALAARGMRFDAAYCNSPLCAPSRASFMSGQQISRIGAYDNAAEFPASVPTFAHYLQGAGYRTCLAGKMHFVGPDQKHGFQDRVTTDIYPSDFAWTPDWTSPDRIDKWYHNMSTVKESGVAVATFQTDYDDEVEYAARRWLIDRGRDKAGGKGAPFCMVASFIHPHDPYVAKPEFWNLYRDMEVDLPSSPEATDPFSRRVMDGIEASGVPLTDDEIRNARRAYFANVSYFDSKIGALVQALDDIGELDNTLVIVTADHGDMLGERGLWYKMSFLEHSVRVPLVIAGPGVSTGTSDAPVSLVDILPTFLKVAGVSSSECRPGIDGTSLTNLMRGDTEDREVIAEYLAEMAGHPAFMIRRGAFKYIHCDGDPPQLYNLETDPGEVTNLADDPTHAETARAFAEEVAARWDSAALRETVIGSQQARFGLDRAMAAGSGQHWDFNPPRDASNEYVRNHMDWTVAAAHYRYPPLED
ncbi:MAG: choline-sulfatase [Silicimonas sp.]|nr:choline-sulfatase [Silicimonas sp.]